MLRLRPHDAEELSHYSAGTSDVEFLFPWGWGELEGIANRTDYDLTQHAKFSGEQLEYFDQATDERYVPHVIEPAAGATRTMMAFLLAAYDEDEVGGETRTVLRLHPRLAPVQGGGAARCRRRTRSPRRPGRCSTCCSRTSCATTTRPSRSAAATAARTRSARRYCVTVDFDTLDDQAVTVRDRDTIEQDRVPIDELVDTVQARLRPVTAPASAALGRSSAAATACAATAAPARAKGVGQGLTSSRRDLRLRLRPQAPPAARWS